MYSDRTKSFTLVLFFAAILAIPLMIGCGGKGTYPVTGTVIMKETGQPAKELKDYLITFQSVDKPVGANGKVKEDGTFEMGTYTDSDGAILGKHKVAISPPVQIDPDRPPIRSILEPRFQDFEKSGLEATVTSGRNTVQFTVVRKKK